MMRAWCLALAAALLLSATAPVEGATFTFRFIGLVAMGDTTIGAGDEICWINDDILHHTATSDTGSAEIFDSGVLAPGESWCNTFDNQGTFPYLCAIHPVVMVGRVIVQEAGSVQPPPTGGAPPGQVPISSGSSFYSPTSRGQTPVTSKVLTAAYSSRSSFPLTYSDVFAFSGASTLAASALCCL
eukprot:CAMPEP_0114627992 /NCGR_PEP_ID=MMETSP0168-20121206/12586_1 /TAXON_ID=95228 ORGANISM="Vannella sp., Strain DIVA3 517/6/12" /NCGR_SAMPLE_ID=MMETSP0168 /ASSEMBLY_ACC=CAM_ASM_000044 /LENGTH=184 /DNA_ID=CAMNT_0001839351 /DNA_START=31 /DNA_END=582 /DNA_ORIENTATION=+